MKNAKEMFEKLGYEDITKIFWDKVDRQLERIEKENRYDNI